jgi:hypothetical protein
MRRPAHVAVGELEISQKQHEGEDAGHRKPLVLLEK